MEYIVKKSTGTWNADARWDKPFWKHVQTLKINNYMGTKPQHLPDTQARLLYDRDNIFVIFRVEDRYIRAVAKEYAGRVWCDSCVEFFLTPSQETGGGYFNIETNCGGTMLMCHQLGRGRNCIQVLQSDARQIAISHTLPKIVEPEITTPTTWTLEYRLPVALLEKYTRIVRPATGVIWRANFYKCGDETSHPHWLTWSIVNLPQPDFHQPGFFGALQFE